MDAQLPQRHTFGRYEALFPIARGGMAEVYAARSLGEAGFQKLVALKRMRPELAEDARFVAMFLDEGRIAANISSPNVVSTLDLGRADDRSLFLVMELVTGISVAAIIKEAGLRQERIPVDVAVEIVSQAAVGLHDAHEARAPSGEPLGIIHRDCSPHNILVDVGGQVKITDFGIAKAMERQTQSQAGEMKGKLAYLSPEQARGLPVDRRCDVFILGIVAWEMLTQTRLFDGRSAVEVLHKVTSMPIPRVDSMRPDVPPGVADAVAQALGREVDERFRTCRAFENALRSSIPVRPGRAQIGAFVRANGGAKLRNIERMIRSTYSKSVMPGLAGSDDPIPLTTPKSTQTPIALEDTIAPLRPPPLEFTDPTEPDSEPDRAPILEVIGVGESRPPTGKNLPTETLPFDSVDLAGIAHLESSMFPDVPRPIDLRSPDTLRDTDLDQAELERLRHPDPLPGRPHGKPPGLRDDVTEPEVRAPLGSKRRGVSGSIPPPQFESEVYELPMRGGGPARWVMIALAVLVACGGGAAAAWYLRANRATEPPPPIAAPHTPTAPARDEEATTPPPTGPQDEVQGPTPEGSGGTLPRANPRPARPRRRQPQALSDPRGSRAPATLGAGQPAAGDRQAAFEEIPW